MPSQMLVRFFPGQDQYVFIRKAGTFTMQHFQFLIPIQPRPWAAMKFGEVNNIHPDFF